MVMASSALTLSTPKIEEQKQQLESKQPRDYLLTELKQTVEAKTIDIKKVVKIILNPAFTPLCPDQKHSEYFPTWVEIMSDINTPSHFNKLMAYLLAYWAHNKDKTAKYLSDNVRLTLMPAKDIQAVLTALNGL